MIKSADEVAALRTAVEIQNRAFQKFLGRIEKGLTETELMWTMFQCQGEAGATEVGIAMSWTHPGYTFFRQQYPDRQTAPGDFQWFDGGAIYHGHTSDYGASQTSRASCKSWPEAARLEPRCTRPIKWRRRTRRCPSS